MRPHRTAVADTTAGLRRRTLLLVEIVFEHPCECVESSIRTITISCKCHRCTVIDAERQNPEDARGVHSTTIRVRDRYSDPDRRGRLSEERCGTSVKTHQRSDGHGTFRHGAPR